MNTFVIALKKLVKDARGANFVEYMVLVALAITGVAAGTKLLADGMKDGSEKQKTEVSTGFIKK